MLFIDLNARPPAAPMLVGDTVLLRIAGYGDYAAWTALRRESRDHLVEWEPAWRDNDLSRDAYRLRIRHQWREVRRGAGLPFLVFRREDLRLVGGVSLSNIRLGAARSCVVGYWIATPHLRKGYARAALSTALDHAFRTLALNRVEAACQPSNAASLALLERAGFVREGLARDFLNINGRWRDHVLFAITAGDFAANQAKR